jgi:hypothetical protein
LGNTSTITNTSFFDFFFLFRKSIILAGFFDRDGELTGLLADSQSSTLLLVVDVMEAKAALKFILD